MNRRSFFGLAAGAAALLIALLVTLGACSEPTHPTGGVDLDL